MKLRSRLITLVVVALLPMLVFASVMIVFISEERDKALKDNLLDVARALSLAIDRELLASIRTLEALATSQHLDTGELEKFYEQAKRVLEAHRRWDNMLLVDLSGQQLVNLRRPFGSPLPRSGAPELIQQVSETGQPAVSNLFWGYIGQRHLLGVDVPVIRNGKVRYVVTASFSPGLLTKLLLQQRSSPDWGATAIDRNKIIIARTRNIEQLLGKPATALFAAKSGEGKETAWRGITHEGMDIYAGLHRSELSGWTVSVGFPASLIESRKRNVVASLVGGGVLFLLVGAGLAFVFGQRIARSIAALTAAAAALGRGELPGVTVSGVPEVDQVAREIEDAAAKRKRLEKEIAEISERERQRIGQDLHDGLGQELTGIAFLAKGLEEKLSRKSIPEGADAGKIAVLVAQAVSHTHDLARGLSPLPVGGNSLMSALEELAASASSLFDVACRLRCDPPVLLQDNTVATHLYRIAQEAVDNAVKHGEAKQISIELSRENRTGILSVTDNGIGFPETADNNDGLGLRIMRHRAEMIQGSLEIRRGESGETVVLCSFAFPEPQTEGDHDGTITTRD